MNYTKITITVCFLVALFQIDAQAQKKGGKGKKPEPAKVDSLGLSYNYGVLLGTSLQMQGIPSDSINAADVVAGLEAVLKKRTQTADVDRAQQIFTEKMQAAQKAAEVESQKKEKDWFDGNAKKNPKIITLPSGIQYEILKEGNGPKPLASSKVTTHYHGTLIDGKVFDSSVERGQPATFPVNGVIKGWQEILVLMPVGSKWKVYIPSALGYGARSMGNIPPNSILIFEIELLEIK